MIVSEEHRFVFVHIQKTGGNAVTDLLLRVVPDARGHDRLRGGKHATRATLVNEDRSWEDYFTFGFVRNPWARMLSWHTMILRRAETAPHRLPANPFWAGVAERYQSFESFVLDAPDEYSRLSTPQIAFLRTRRKEPDFIGRTERLNEDYADVAARIGAPPVAVVPERNVGSPAHYPDFYTARMRDAIAERVRGGPRQVRLPVRGRRGLT